MRRINKKSSSIAYAILAFFILAAGVLYFNKTSSMAYWIEEENGKKYTMVDGSFAVGFQNIDEQFYYFDADGYLLTGKFYVEAEDSYYFADENGVVLYGAILHEGQFYYANEEGKLQKGFIEYENNRYYFDKAANLVKDWFKVEGNWYYADKTGAIQTGFLSLDGYRYYLNPDGTRVSDTIAEIEGITYIFNSDGSIDENATTLYPVYQYIAEKRKGYGLPEIVMNSKVQACAILRAADLKNGYRIEDGVTVSVSDLLKNHGVGSVGGFEISYGGVEEYGTERLISDMEKDLNLQTILKDETVSELGIGVYVKDNISYYDVIFICKEK